MNTLIHDDDYDEILSNDILESKTSNELNIRSSFHNNDFRVFPSTWPPD
jgi:hypothetical protein